MFVKKIVFAAVLAASAYAQESTPTETSTGGLPTSTSNLTPCIINCASTSAGCTFTDPTCVCTNTDYQQLVIQCLTTDCPDDIPIAEAYQAELCGSTSSVSTFPTSSLSSVLSGISSSLSSRVSSASSRISSLSSSRSSATSSPTSTAGGSGGAAGLSASLLATGGAVLLGVIGGGLLVF